MDIGRRVCRDQPNATTPPGENRPLYENTIATQDAQLPLLRNASCFSAEELANGYQARRNFRTTLERPPAPKFMRDSRVAGGFLKIVMSED